MADYSFGAVKHQHPRDYEINKETKRRFEAWKVSNPGLLKTGELLFLWEELAQAQTFIHLQSEMMANLTNRFLELQTKLETGR